MPTIPYPNVPSYPGVPPVPRQSPGSPTPTFNLAYGSGGPSASPVPQWGVFVAGTQESIYDPTEGGTLSFYEFGIEAAAQVSDFPVEAPGASSSAGFASYNKVYVPTTPRVTLALAGTDGEKQAFLSVLELAKETTSLWDVYTPDAYYTGYTLDRYSYRRSATRGATLLTVELCFTQVKQITQVYANTPVNSPQSPSAQNPVNNGATQPQVPSSLLYKAFNSNSGSALGF